MKRRPGVPISPGERRAQRAQRLVLVTGLGFALMVAILLVQGPWREGATVRAHHATLSEDLARNEAASALAQQLESENAEQLEAAAHDLDELLPRRPDEKQWHDMLVMQASSFGLTQVRVELEDRPEDQRLEAPPPETASEDDIGVAEPLATVRSTCFHIKAVGRLREVLGFAGSLGDVRPIMRPARLAIKRMEVPFNHVELDLSLSCFWRVPGDENAG